jgi:DNA repair ATPase RecN
MNEDELLRIKKRLDAREKEVTEAEGQLKLLHKELKDTYGVNTVKEARKLLAEYDEQLSDVDNTIDDLTTQLKGLMKEMGI